MLILLGTTLSAQKTFTAGIIGGVNGCQIHGDSYSGFDQIGFVGGGFVVTNPGAAWQAQFGIQYSRKGSRHLVSRDLGGYRDFELRMHYIDIPLMVKYNTKKVFFDFGAAFGILFKTRFWDANGEATPQEFKKWELSMIGGIGYNLSDYFFIELTTQHSILPFKDFTVPMYYQRWLSNLFNKGMYHNMMGVMFGFRFGGGGANE